MERCVLQNISYTMSSNQSNQMQKAEWCLRDNREEDKAYISIQNAEIQLSKWCENLISKIS